MVRTEAPMFPLLPRIPRSVAGKATGMPAHLQETSPSLFPSFQERRTKWLGDQKRTSRPTDAGLQTKSCDRATLFALLRLGLRGSGVGGR